MATHARTAIRNAVKAVLDPIAATSGRVYIGKSYPLAKKHQPALLIYTPSETSSRDAMGQPAILARPLTLHIEIRVATPTPPDELLDTIAVEVEAAMAADLSLGGRLRNMQLVDMQQIVTTGDGDMHVGGQRIEYHLTYRTPEGVPATIV